MPASGVIRDESEKVRIILRGAAIIADIPMPSSFRLRKRFIMKNTISQGYDCGRSSCFQD